MEALADAVCLRTVGIRLRVLDVVDRQVQRIVVTLGTATELGAAIREDAEQVDAVFELIRDNNDNAVWKHSIGIAAMLPAHLHRKRVIVSVRDIIQIESFKQLRCRDRNLIFNLDRRDRLYTCFLQM